MTKKCKTSIVCSLLHPQTEYASKQSNSWIIARHGWFTPQALEGKTAHHWKPTVANHSGPTAPDCSKPSGQTAPDRPVKQNIVDLDMREHPLRVIEFSRWWGANSWQMQMCTQVKIVFACFIRRRTNAQDISTYIYIFILFMHTLYIRIFIILPMNRIYIYIYIHSIYIYIYICICEYTYIYIS